MPKRIVIALCVVLIFFVGWAFGQEHQLNAAGWADMGTTDSLAGLMYVKGYTEGYRDGHIKMVLISQTKNSPAQAAVTQLLQLETTRAEDLAGFGHAKGIKMNAIETTMTSFYADYRNAPVCWADALQFSVWSLTGNAATDRELDSARKIGAETGCK